MFDFSTLALLCVTLVIARADFVRAQTPDALSDEDSRLLESGSASGRSANDAPVEQPTGIKIVSYNMRWRGGDDLKEIIRLLREDKEIGGACVIGLQEVDRDTKRNGNVNTARVIAESLGMHYAWAAPPRPPDDEKKTEDETGVAILSLHPLTDIERIVLPNPGPGKRRRAGIGATLRVGAEKIRVYSVHAETRIPTRKKIEQLSFVLDSLARRKDVARAVVLGDFNTWRPDDKRDAIKLFTDANFATPFPPGERTFRLPMVGWRLDWIWLRGFPTPDAHGIARHVEISDHYPLWITVKLSENRPDACHGK